MKRTITPILSGKRIAYSGMATAFLAVASDADGQIVYTDVDPDLQLVNDQFMIDFDGDGTDDFTIMHGAGSYSGLQIAGVGMTMASGNAVIGNVSSSYLYPTVLALNAPIAPGNPAFQVSPSYGTLALSFVGYGNYGTWFGQTGYLGVRFVSGGGTTHYAWIHLSVANGAASATIMGYAYQSTANTAINAGDMGSTGLAHAARPLSVLGLAPNPASDRTWITIDAQENGPVQLALVNTIGEVLKEETVSVGNGSNRVAIDLDGVPAGTYFVRVQSGDKVAHRKLTVAGAR